MFVDPQFTVADFGLGEAAQAAAKVGCRGAGQVRCNLSSPRTIAAYFTYSVVRPPQIAKREQFQSTSNVCKGDALHAAAFRRMQHA